MIKLNQLKTLATRAVGRSGLYLKKYSPEILTFVGIAGCVTAAVMACKASMSLEETMEEAKEEIEEVHEKEETLPTNEYRKELAHSYGRCGMKFVKLYGPSVSLGAASIACILGAHNIMQKRNVALIAACKTVEEAFSDYRNRVIEDLGSEKDKEYRYGIKNELATVTEETKDGETKKETKEVSVAKGYSQYARFFDDGCREWSKVPEYNLLFLRNQQNYANDLLRSRGHVFLNEVYDMLGIHHSQAGAVVGWVLGEGNANYIDFGMYNVYDEKARDFVNGYEPTILLDFNVDGIIYDKI